MAETTSEGLNEGSLESSSSEELYSGSLETPAGSETEATETPRGDEPPAEQPDGKSEDSELDSGIFTDLERDIPEALKPHAESVKKKMQAVFTKKTQAISERLKTLESNQLTDEIKQDFSKLYGWYEKIQSNPQAGLKELASQLGVSVKSLVDSAEAEGQKEQELTEADLVTVDDYARFARQEARKAAEEIRAKEVSPLKEYIARHESAAVQQEHIKHGATVLESAMAKLQGFAVEVDGKKVLSEDAKKALAMVVSQENFKTKEFFGPNALENAFMKVSGQNSLKKMKDLETQLANLKKNLAGVSSAPGKSAKTTLAPSSPARFWDDLKSESLL